MYLLAKHKETQGLLVTLTAMNPEELSVTMLTAKNLLLLHNCSACSYCLFNTFFMTVHIHTAS